MKRYKLLLICSLLSVVANAQNIKGTVVDNLNNPIEFATIVLQTTDSLYIDATYSDSLGGFTFAKDISNFRLITQHLLYESKVAEFSNPQVGTISLADKDNMLSEVVVKGERPVVRVVNGRMTYDMPQLLKDKIASSAYESLLELPGVSDYNDKLNLAGSSSLTIMINGKPSTMTPDQLIDLLKNTPKERVQSAEVMYSAPPQYHVRGSVINVVLTGGTSDTPTLQGQVNGAYTQYRNADYKLGGTLLYSGTKFSTDLMYSFGYDEKWSKNDLTSNHLLNGTNNKIEQRNINRSTAPSHNIRLGADYYFDNNNKINMAYTTQVKPWVHTVGTSTGSYSESRNKKTYDRPSQMHNIALNYTSSFGLSLGGDYTYYTNHNTQNFEEKTQGSEDAFNTASKQDINRISVYADQSHELSNDWSLEYGAKFKYALDKSSQDYSSLRGKDLSASNSEAKNGEYTYNFYAGFSKTFSEKLSLSASLTGEYYKFNDYDEWSLFPSMELSYNPAPSHILQLSVSTDKAYPDYWSMMSSVSHMNAYTEIHGNPNLRPSKEYSLNLNYILKSKYVFSFYASQEDNFFIQLPYQSASQLKLIYQTINMDYSRRVGFYASLPFSISNILNSSVQLNAFYHNDKSNNFHDLSFNNHNIALYSSLRNTFNISSKPNIKAELNGIYFTKNIQGPSELSKIYKVDAGLKWTFAGGNAEIKIAANDIFNSASVEYWDLKFATQDIRMHLHPNSRNFGASFTYKFGNYKHKENKSVDTSRFGQ